MLALIGIIGMAWVSAVALLFALTVRGTLIALWREPVLREPVLIIESDDWGPGPEGHAEVLRRLAAVLAGFRDGRGRHPVMTLGMVLAVVDTARVGRDGATCYRRLLLSERRFCAVREAILEGVAAGVFAPQLHGMEHYWPPALLSAAASDEKIRAWLSGSELPPTEALPSYLQSRWTDASTLPSRPIPQQDAETAVAEEVKTYEAIFGRPPDVVVPPTFVWNRQVERAWVGAGIGVLVTPGVRYEGRGEEGELCGAGEAILNGEKGESGVLYIVRDDYFEPALGHRAERVLAAMRKKTALGRPTLLETHRFNFTGAGNASRHSLTHFQEMLARVTDRFTRVRFMSTAQLAVHLACETSELRESRVFPRVGVWLRRMREIPAVRRLARLTGLAVPLWLLEVSTRFSWRLAGDARREGGG